MVASFNPRAEWARIEEWLRRHAPETAADLRPPAATAEIQAAEREFGAVLPPDVCASWQVHDGQEGSAPPVFPTWRLLPLEYAVREFLSMRALLEEGVLEVPGVLARGPVHAVWWSPGWIPLLSNGSGDSLCVDVSPPEGGIIGQVVSFYGRASLREVVAPGFGEWLARAADEFEAGRLGADEDGWIVRIP